MSAACLCQASKSTGTRRTWQTSCAHAVGCDLAIADYTYGVPDGPLESKRLSNALMDMSDRARAEFPRCPEAEGLLALRGHQAARLIRKELPVRMVCIPFPQAPKQGLASCLPDGS